MTTKAQVPSFIELLSKAQNSVWTNAELLEVASANRFRPMIVWRAKQEMTKVRRGVYALKNMNKAATTLDNGLTSLETSVMRIWPLNYDTVDAQLEDNCTYTDAPELIKSTGIPKSSIGGVISSLIKKGFVMHDSDAANGEALLVLTDDGISKVFEMAA